MRFWSRQRAGANSQQLLVSGTANVYNGLTSDQVLELVTESVPSVVAEYFGEGRELATENVMSFSQLLVKELFAAGCIDVLRDPSFQDALRRAQLGAATTDRPVDHEMIVGLLASRAQRVERIAAASIQRAVEVVHELDDQALCGLTVFSAVARIRPTMGTIRLGLDTLEQIFSDIIEFELPTGTQWLDHLETLSAVRLNTVARNTRFIELHMEMCKGYMSSGVEADRELNIVARLADLSPVVLRSMDHELRPGFRRLAYPNLESLREVVEGRVDESTAKQILEIAEFDYRFGSVHESVLNGYYAEISSRSTLHLVQEWWDSIPYAVDLTGVGNVLASSNARRLERHGHLPPMQ